MTDEAPRPAVVEFVRTSRADVPGMLRTVATMLEEGSHGDPAALRMTLVVLGPEGEKGVWGAGHVVDLPEATYWLLGLAQRWVLDWQGPG